MQILLCLPKKKATQSHQIQVAAELQSLDAETASQFPLGASYMN